MSDVEMSSARRVAKKAAPPPVPAPAPGPQKMAQFNMRLPVATQEALDARLREMNAGRRIQLTQSELVRAVIEWYLEHKPDVEK